MRGPVCFFLPCKLHFSHHGECMIILFKSILCLPLLLGNEELSPIILFCCDIKDLSMVLWLPPFTANTISFSNLNNVSGCSVCIKGGLIFESNSQEFHLNVE